MFLAEVSPSEGCDGHGNDSIFQIKHLNKCAMNKYFSNKISNILIINN